MLTSNKTTDTALSFPSKHWTVLVLIKSNRAQIFTNMKDYT